MSSSKMPEAVLDLRRRVLAGETPTREQIAEGITMLREHRSKATTSKKKAPAPVIDLASLFDEPKKKEEGDESSTPG